MAAQTRLRIIEKRSELLKKEPTKYQNRAEKAEKKLKKIFHSTHRSVLANSFLSNLSQNCQALSSGAYQYTPEIHASTRF
jgi:tRNA(Glu) U13 pseudouridine synthase TruD